MSVPFPATKRLPFASAATASGRARLFPSPSPDASMTCVIAPPGAMRKTLSLSRPGTNTFPAPSTVSPTPVAKAFTPSPEAVRISLTIPPGVILKALSLSWPET